MAKTITMHEFNRQEFRMAANLLMELWDNIPEEDIEEAAFIYGVYTDLITICSRTRQIGNDIEYTYQDKTKEPVTLPGVLEEWERKFNKKGGGQHGKNN